MKKTFFILLSASGLLLSASCKKWLDVKPRDLVSEDQLFNTEQGFYSALNAAYLDMTRTESYGGHMTMEMMDVFGQQYNVGGQHQLVTLGSYSYGQDTVKTRLANAWRASYTMIANINKLLSVVDEKQELFSPRSNYQLVKGEALALRAFLHFDILRLFGPVYATADSTLNSIPYNDQFSTKFQPLMPANQVVEKVLKDLDSATFYLDGDPVRTAGRLFSAEPNGGSNFWRFRPLRLNYFAVRALAARVHLYRRNRPAALAAAKEVIAAQPVTFPWITPNKILSDKQNPDRIFHTEMLFGLHDIKLVDKQTRYFDGDATPTKILAPLPARLSATYENNNTADYRNNISIWAIPATGGKDYRCFFKYADVGNSEILYRNIIPLIRVSEAYYIAAEAEDDKATALGYLNLVRKNRGLLDVPATATVATEIRNEYKREFIGEGQLFFYYKRTFTTSVPNGSSTANITMNKGSYCPPLPEEEIRYRD
ncbi:RagB/SusD family nutrient uptake outer membrane protein [Chitinophaga lutea]